MRLRTVFLLGAVWAFSLISTGHAQDLPFPETADILMNNFLHSYGEMNLEEYNRVLHPDFRFIFQPFDVEDLGLPTDYIDQDDELIIANNMFQGLVEPVIAQIHFNIFNPAGVWEPSAHPDFPPPAMSRIYLIDMAVFRPTHTTILIEGYAEFFAVARDSVIEGGSVVPYWELLGHRDLTGMAQQATENTTWGQFKWLYRGDTVPVIDNLPDLVSARLTSLHPNPFNPNLAISFTVNLSQYVCISVHDLAGHHVVKLEDRLFSSGTHMTGWDGRNTRGQAVASGIYIVRLEAADHLETRKIILAR
jgi:hypothetical protein